MELTVVKAAPAGIYVAFSLALVVWHSGAALLGVFLADRLGVSQSGFDLKSDLKKTALCSLAALSLFFALFYFAQNAAVVIVYLLAFVVSLKIAYLGENHGFLLLVQGAALAGMVLFAPVAGLLKLPGLFLLYLALLAALLNRARQAKKRAREILDLEQANERRIRAQARSDPGFTTFCYQCLYYRSELRRCQLQLDGLPPRRVTLDGRALCASFRPDRAAAAAAKE